MTLRALIAACVGVLVLAACGGDDGTPAAGPSTPAATAPAAGPTGAPSPPALAGQFPFDPAQVTGRVTYEVNVSGGAASPPPTRNLTLSFNPPQFAVLSQGNTLIDTGGEQGVVNCSAGQGGQTQCQEVPAAQIGQGGVVQGVLQTLTPLFGISQSLANQGQIPGANEVSESQIAGRTGLCTEVDPQALGGQIPEPIALCADQQTGIPLRLEIPGQQGATQMIEATEFTDPRPEDFQPPASVQPAPTAPPGGVPPGAGGGGAPASPPPTSGS